MPSNEYFADGNVLKFARPVNGVKVEQRVSNGFINGTAMCSAHGKDIAQWLLNKATLELFNALAKRLGKTTYQIKDWNSNDSRASRLSALFPDLLIVRRGSPENGGGTWIHPKLAVHLAQWCNTDFALLVSDWIEEWLLAGQNPFKVDLDKEFEAWQQRHEFRVYLKDFLRPELMSAVVRWAVANHKSPITLCSQVHDLMNERIQGHKSKDLKALNGLPLGELIRDYFDAPPLVIYSAINTLATNAINERFVDPIEAVNHACDQFLAKAYNPKPIPLTENLYAQGRRLAQTRKRRQIAVGTQLELPFGNQGQAV